MMAGLGPVAGPVGAIAGMVIGGLLGTMFDDKTEPRVGLAHGTTGDSPTWFEDSVWKQSDIGLVGFRGASHEMDANSQEWQNVLDMVVMLDDAFASIMSDDQLAAARANLEAWEGDLKNLEGFGPDTLGEIFKDRFKEITAVFEGEIGTAMHEWTLSFQGTGEEFMQGATAWLMGMEALEDSSDRMQEYFLKLMKTAGDAADMSNRAFAAAAIQFAIDEEAFTENDFFNGTIGKALQTWIEEFEGEADAFQAGLGAWMVALEEMKEMPEHLQQFAINLINSAKTSEEMLAAAGSAVVIGSYITKNPEEDYLEQRAEAEKSLWTLLKENTEETYKLIDAYDGSIESTEELALKIQDRYALELMLVEQIHTALKNISAVIQSQIERIETANLTDKQSYEYYQKKIDDEYARLLTLEDPAEIEQSIMKILDYFSKMVGFLSPEQMEKMGSFLITFLTDLDTLAQTKLGKSLDEITAGNEEVGEDLSAAIGTAFEPVTSSLNATSATMKTAADTLSTAANTMVAASNTMVAAANAIPRTINVKVNVNSLGSESSIYG
jgi:hypothetical protein